MVSPVSARPLPLTSTGVPAVFSMLSEGEPISVVTGELGQSPAPAQSGSPPPVTLATLVTFAAAAAVGVTLIVKLAEPPTARPAGTVQLTSCPLTAQPVAELMVRRDGTTSITIAGSNVADVPALVTTIT